MTVLYILGTLLVIALIFVLVEKINAFSISNYNYEFFTWGNLFFTTTAYLSIFYGRKWYLSALVTDNGDTLNGVVLIVIGVLMLLGLLITHMKSTNFIFGFAVGFLQLALYVPASVASVLAFIMAAAWLSETKPVVNLN